MLFMEKDRVTLVMLFSNIVKPDHTELSESL